MLSVLNASVTYHTLGMPTGRPSADSIMRSTGQTPTGGNSDAVVITLSAEAKASLATQAGAQAAARPNPREAYYAQFFPTRAGTSPAALANAVSEPGSASSSANLSSSQVAIAARQSLDAQYAAMTASGKSFDRNSKDGVDINTLMSGLDRRSLSSVSTNANGLFTKQEQDFASDLMIQQQGLAMGQYEGPTDAQSKFIDPFMGDTARQAEAGVKFLDGVNGDEKTTIAWGSARASSQQGYEGSMAIQGKTPDNLDSDNPIASVIYRAMNTMKSDPLRSHTIGNLKTISDLESQPWFQGFDIDLDNALAETKALYLNRIA